MPLPLLDHLDTIRDRIAAASDLFVVLGFDGTLTRIVDLPGSAWLDTDTRRIVTELARRPHVKVIVASGRALDDLRLRVGISSVIYVGNHGLEMNGPGFTFDRIAPTTTEDDLSRIAATLRERVCRIPGIVVENKRLSIGVHYRLTPDYLVGEVRNVVDSCINPNLHIIEGLKVFDIQPNVSWNKGTASAWLRRVLGLEKALTICIGDDRTDEDVFEALSDGVTIKVGANATEAGYSVAGPADVRRFLQWLTEGPLVPASVDALSAAL